MDEVILRSNKKDREPMSFERFKFICYFVAGMTAMVMGFIVAGMTAMVMGFIAAYMIIYFCGTSGR